MGFIIRTNRDLAVHSVPYKLDDYSPKAVFREIVGRVPGENTVQWWTSEFTTPSLLEHS
jgi:hypothetical protein